MTLDQNHRRARIALHGIDTVKARCEHFAEFSTIEIVAGGDGSETVSFMLFTRTNVADFQDLADAINAVGVSPDPVDECDEPEPTIFDDALATKLGREDALDAKLRDAGRGHLVR